MLKLTSLVTSNFVNEARVSFQRNTDNSIVTDASQAAQIQALGITPGTGGFEEPPVFIDLDPRLYCCSAACCPTLGRRINFSWPIRFPGSTGSTASARDMNMNGRTGRCWMPVFNKGLMFEIDLNTLLVGTAGNANPFGTGFNQGCLFCVESIPGEHGITHFYDVHNQTPTCWTTGR